MFKAILDMLDKVPEDSLTERINKDPVGKKYYFYLGGAILFSICFIMVSMLSITKFKNSVAPPTFMIKTESMEIEQIITLPFPHQSLKNVQSWLTDAIMTAYSFNFNTYHEQVAAAEFYFTPEGYATYVQSLRLNRIEEEVVGKNILISSIPIQDPILINAGMVGDTEFWRFRVPILVSYIGGKEVINEKFIVETLVLRVPAYQNHRALGIAEFNMTAM